MKRFITARLADIADVKGGKRLPPNTNLVTNPTSHPYIRGKDIRDGRITFNDPMYVLEEDFDKIRRYTVNRGEICITIVGNIGDVGITPPNLHRASLTENAVKLVNLRSEFDAQFLMYALLAPDAQSQMKLSAAGAAQPKLGIYKVNEIKVPAPPLPVQRRIAGILSAYDELIENSQRRIRIVETMARALYREWFVHFRFPGHETHPRVPSPLGDIPKGWEVKPLSALCSRMESGGTPKRKSPEYWVDGSIDWFKTGELWDGFLFGSEEKITELGQRESNARIFEPGTILMAIYGSPTVGRLGIVTRPSSCNQAALGLVADKKQISQTFLYFVLLSLRDHFNGLAQGAAQQNISKEKVANALALVPPPELVAAFDRLAEPTFGQIQTLQRQAQNLRRTRDLLLPRLLSGQVELEKEAA